MYFGGYIRYYWIEKYNFPNQDFVLHFVCFLLIPMHMA